VRRGFFFALQEHGMVVPHEKLQPETLTSLIEEFVSRDGAVQGHRDISAQEKAAAVMRQLELGAVVIVFDEESETCTIVANEMLTLGNASVGRRA
jgi:uncharacterized protein YheU (UPF0270 family)